ncbi:MAG: CPBP family intramembrane metalloprotease [Oscillospiraceae bacterium]|nr:CPBP family intramembrane metalloprotease [Oscillospiraceae bacterium]MBQ4486806.1 CPBP family intramembrane metalloprotease [Oscillospiraceae bacterium]
MEKYTYRPVRFYVTVFALTWGWWLLALLFRDTSVMFLFMAIGLFMPAVTAIVTVLTSKNKMLKEDLKRKIVGFYRIKPLSIVKAVLLFLVCVVVSIGISVLFGGSPEQFSFTEDFSFSIAGTSALLTMVLASIIEEVGWRGYGEDAVGSYHTWFRESIIFGCIWACWHLPLFLIPGTYHYTLKEMGALYVINFLVSAIPVDFLQTWVYVKNNRSMLATAVFHLFLNVMQEKINISPETKCIETVVMLVAAAIVVAANKELFFDKSHIGNLLEVQYRSDESEKK